MSVDHQANIEIRSKMEVWLTAIRPKTLWAGVAPVLVGVAMAVEAGVVHWLAAALALAGALLIQIGTNFFNDYADFKQGADNEKRKGPLRVTQAGLVSPEAIRNATFLVFGLAVAAGAFLMYRGGLPIVIIGVLSILCGFLYTAGKYSLAYLGLGDLFVLIFFGPVAVGGTYYVQALSFNDLVLWAGFAPGLLFCILGAAAVPVVLYFKSGEHPAVFVASFVALTGLGLFRKIVQTPPSPALNPVLGATARLLLFYSIAFAITWNL